MNNNALNWFEIYVSDFARAKTFYEAILNTSLIDPGKEGCQMGMFPHNMEAGAGGSITEMEGFKPGPGGTVVYLNVEGDLDGVISRIPDAGGKIVKDKFAIPPHGYIALFSDTEGNIVGLHSLK